MKTEEVSKTKNGKGSSNIGCTVASIVIILAALISFIYYFSDKGQDSVPINNKINVVNGLDQNKDSVPINNERNAVDRLDQNKKIDENKKIENFFSEFKSMYNELLEIKNHPDFKKYGFAIGGPYNGWLIRVQEFKKNSPEPDLLSKKGTCFGELEALGYEYVSSKGKETDVTKWFNDTFKKAIDKQDAIPISNDNEKDKYKSNESISSKKDRSGNQYCTGKELLAYNYAIDFVKQQLKSPSSAKFPSSSEKMSHTINDELNCRYKINSWVDSENSFGAKLRRNFSCIIIFKNDEVFCDELNFE
jgi:hypothetical protein